MPSRVRWADELVDEPSYVRVRDGLNATGEVHGVRAALAQNAIGGKKAEEAIDGSVRLGHL